MSALDYKTIRLIQFAKVYTIYKMIIGSACGGSNLNIYSLNRFSIMALHSIDDLLQANLA
jgi:hypothetical protein